MQCPPEIAAIVGEIIRTGLLRIRVLDDVARCRSAAYHLHNLPGLLTDYAPELLDYYWTVERVGFIESSTPEEAQLFEPLWKLLAKHVRPAKQQALAG
jgi:hypothetical protein